MTVSDPSGLVFHYRTLRLTSTLQTGSGKGNVTYPTDFSGGAHTNYTGLYSVAFNGTLASGNFTVALTDKSEYVRRYLIRGEEEAGLVDIQGSGYDNETVDINIAYYDGDILIPVLSTQGNASNGILQYNWEIPENITLATYRVILTSEMSDKPIEDAQNFTVIEIMVSCQAVNKYDQEPLADVSVKAYHLALGSAFFIDDRRTNGTGWVDFLVEGRGFYSFGIYWREARVGSLNLTNVGGDATGYVLRNRFHIESELAQVTMKVSSGEGPLPFIEVALRNVTSVPSRIPSVETDYSGIVTTHAFTDVSYRIEARRYGHLFFNQSIGNVTETVGTLTEPYPIQCPTLTLFVAVLDSKEQPIRGASVEMIEWGSGRVAAEGETSEWGSVRLDSIFGRYKVRVYDYSELWGETVLVNETVVDVIRDEFYLLVRCGRVNVTLSVRVVDYFGNPIPNAMVKLEQEGREVLSLTTNSDGVVRKEGILGGDYRISLYVAGRLTTARSLTVADSEQLLLRSRDYVVIWGVPFISNRLVTGILLAVMVGAVMLLTYRRRLKQS
ncbi:hypothetical protein GWN63_02445 [Candidatus Bathyarchaeota archaeon]|nr:carboxypeptidase regulatory-like domain-containing protein [Candidatus Bathyarchaeota archaeon]NIU81091.1 hypothetical protein [Candidatus Bathyarchaeota archaeon]NIV67727.1 hypothetical protein [Candidatus Bathyarchaeota archaeon]NIW34332.1 hypothetical protein [Candidatus Bathyarchaeota archaeon]